MKKDKENNIYSAIGFTIVSSTKVNSFCSLEYEKQKINKMMRTWQRYNTGTQSLAQTTATEAIAPTLVISVTTKKGETLSV